MMPDLEQQIRERAYWISESDGHPTGRAADYWFQAERELTAFGEDILAARRSGKKAPKAAKAAAPKQERPAKRRKAA